MHTHIHKLTHILSHRHKHTHTHPYTYTQRETETDKTERERDRKTDCGQYTHMQIKTTETYHKEAERQTLAVHSCACKVILHTQREST